MANQKRKGLIRFIIILGLYITAGIVLSILALNESPATLTLESIFKIPLTTIAFMCLPLPLIFLYLHEEWKHTREAQTHAQTIIEREAQLKMALDAGELGIWDWDIKNDILKIYDETSRLYNADEDLLMFQPSALWNEYIHPDDLKDFENRLDSYMNGDTRLFKSEYRFKPPASTEYIWVIDRGKVIKRDNGGKPVRLIGVFMDIDKRKKDEEELENLKNFFQTLVETSSDLIWEVDEDDNIVYLSPKLKDLLGYEPEELYGKKTFDVIPPQNRKKVKEFYDSFNNPPRPIVGAETIYLHKDGHEVYFETSGVPIIDEKGTLRGFRGIDRDVTKRKKSETELRELKEFFQSLVETTSDIIWVIDENDNYTYLSPNVKKILGYEPEELYGKKAVSLMSSEEADRVNGLWDDAYTPIVQLESRNIHKNGHIVILETSGIPVFDDQDNPRGFRGIDRDITEGKRVKNKLRESEALFKAVFDSITEGIMVVGNDGKISKVNKRFLKMWGLPFRNTECFNLDNILTYINRHLKNSDLFYLDVKKDAWSSELLMIEIELTDDRIFQWFSDPLIKDKKEAGRIYYFRDVTEKKKNLRKKRKIEERTQQAQKMETIGRIAGGVAHDFNNLLTGIIGTCESFIQTRTVMDQELREYNDAITNTAKRAGDLTKKLLDFSRKGKFISKTIDIHQTLKDAISILQRSNLDRTTVIQMKLNAEPSCVVGDPSQLQNVFLNIGLNAIDAMPEGGTLTISTSNKFLDSNSAVHISDEFVAGHYVLISISDTGMGMTEDVMANIFEPFFTTKGSGCGTGLGLSAVYGSIKNHNGRINVSSNPGKGAEFLIYLPEDHNKIESEVLMPETMSGERFCILLVDDDELVRVKYGEALQHSGHHVLLASNGEEAVEIYQRKQDIIELVILDMVMPEMDGKDTFIALNYINPDIKVLIVSGYSNQNAIQELLIRGAVGFLQKPYTLDELSAQAGLALGKKACNHSS
ncbi:MAG: PAS domain S-box protein [Desulfobacterales bacterium]|nr:PAS domain S-box protein [Desulfobacterales bacterium]